MNELFSENELRQAHSDFHADHQRLRGELLSSLNAPNVAVAGARKKVSRAVWMTIAVSACCVITLVIWTTVGSLTVSSAYALDGIQERFLHVRSLYVKETEYLIVKIDGKKVEKVLAYESYHERPSRYFQVGYGIEQDANGVRIRKSVAIGDGDKMQYVNETDRTVTQYTVDPLSMELSVESRLQNQCIEQFLRGPTASYEFSGNEEMNGQKTLKYQCVNDHDGEKTRNVIWINPDTRLPVRARVYELDSEGAERLSRDFERIEFNQPPPANIFPFPIPDGYHVQEDEINRDNFVRGSGQAKDDRAASRYMFAIDNLAVLVCWYHGLAGQKIKQPEDDPIVPEVELRGSSGHRRCELHPLQVQSEDGDFWRWSLVIPADRRPIHLEESLALVFKYPSGSQSTLGGYPLHLDDQTLKDAISRIRQLGKEVGEPEPDMTLLRLRWLARRLTHPESKTND